MKKVKIRTPSRRIVIKTKRERYGIAVCANCKKPLHGVPASNRKLSKTEKRPSRAYGGYLCSSCTRELFKDKARTI